jgi:hypothetical protein
MEIIFLTTVYPLCSLRRVCHGTSLWSASYWTVVAWAAWGLLFCMPGRASEETLEHTGYLALCLTGCAVVAVLGSRRPHVGAWNFVVLGLLGVLLMPLALFGLVGGPVLHGASGLFLLGILAVGVLNYLPTRLCRAALFVGLGCVGVFLQLMFPNSVYSWLAVLSWYLAALAPWVAFFSWKRRDTSSAFDTLWLDFRDRYGLFWGQRVREQFNASVTHSGLPVRLGWQGLCPLPGADAPDEGQTRAAAETLRALLKRFGPPE